MCIGVTLCDLSKPASFKNCTLTFNFLFSSSFFFTVCYILTLHLTHCQIASFNPGQSIPISN